MSTTTRTQRTVAARPAAPARVPLSLVTIAALVAGAIVTELYATVARFGGIEFVVSSFGSEPTEIPIFGFFMGVLIDGSPGLVLALVLARWARHPRRTWTRTTWVLTAVSLLPPLVMAEADIATKVALAVAHVVAAAVVIPLVAARLAPLDPRRS